MSLTGKTKAGTYKQLLNINHADGVTSTTRNIVDGEGTASAISLSDDQVVITPKDADGTAILRVTDKDANTLLAVDSTNDVVKANGNAVNTNIKEFHMNSSSAFPTSADTWTALFHGNGRTVMEVQGGGGATPNTSFTIGTTADDIVAVMWYVPFNITIDSCHVFFGADASGGDDVKFSVMSYTVDTANGSTSGDLSSGVENCVSPATITGAGYEQAYYQSLTVSTADVDAGKAIVAFVHQDGTSADLGIHMQLVYHLR